MHLCYLLYLTVTLYTLTLNYIAIAGWFFMSFVNDFLQQAERNREKNYWFSINSSSDDRRDLYKSISEACDDFQELVFLSQSLSQNLKMMLGSSSAGNDSDSNVMTRLCAELIRDCSLIEKNSIRAITTLKMRRQHNKLDFSHAYLFLMKIEQKFLEEKERLRKIYRLAGSLFRASDWQSPTYNTSLYFREISNTQIAEHVLDYKRDGHIEGISFEKKFTDEYLSHLGSTKFQSYLCNSGMAALSTISSWLEQELSLTGPFLAIEPMYFECLHILEGTHKKLIRESLQSDDEIIKSIELLRPQVLYLDTITNTGTQIKRNLSKLLPALSSYATKEKPVFIVADTTCEPALLLDENLFGKLKEDSVSVILYESLAKYHQYGMDTVMAGIISISCSEYLHTSLKKHRARSGSIITDSSVGSLPVPNLPLIKKRLMKMSRNCNYLRERLAEYTLSPENLVLESSYSINCSQKYDDGFVGSTISILFKSPFDSLNAYRFFEAACIEIAKSYGLPLSQSTSFGFDESRLYVTAPSTMYEKPFLRFSIGRESSIHLQILSDVIIEALNKTSSEFKEQTKEETGNFKYSPDINFPVKKPAGVFSGEVAIETYLDPDTYPATPYIELPDKLNPFKKEKIRIFAKIAHQVPLLNIKSFPAFSMLKNAKLEGKLDAVSAILESSSSNTVLSLSVLSEIFGLKETIGLVDETLDDNLRKLLRLFNVSLALHPLKTNSGILPIRSELARKIGTREGFFNPDQYSNPRNPEGFSRWLAPELWRQSEHQLRLLSVAVGASGTIVGTASYLKTRCNKIQVIACMPEDSSQIPGPREEKLLSDTKFGWDSYSDKKEKIGTATAYQASLQLLRNGILAGPSSGMNFQGLLNVLKRNEDFDVLRNEQGELHTAFICCDSPLQHVDEYFRILPSSSFPEVKKSCEI